jgi:hypothetical protein
MPKANPLAKISKKLSALQAKSEKLNSEIKVLAAIVADEAKKAAVSSAVPTPSTKVPAKALALGPKQLPPRRRRQALNPNNFEAWHLARPHAQTSQVGLNKG